MSGKIRSSHGQFRSGQVKVRSSLDLVMSGQGQVRLRSRSGHVSSVRSGLLKVRLG